jgi:formylglycine-generating enzyme required for sulfatase activity
VIAGRFESAAAYCNWLSQREGIPREQWCYPASDSGSLGDLNAMPADFLARRGYRLPTEAEWEYASRANATTPHHFGQRAEIMDDYAWFIENSPRLPSAVGLKKPNDLGGFDLLGNMYEWCHRGHPESSGTQPRQALGVLRGGSFLLERRNCTSLYRYAFAVQLQTNPIFQQCVGFRVARTLPPTEP